MATAAEKNISTVIGWFERFDRSLMSSTSGGRSNSRSPFDFGVVTARQFAPKRQVRPQVTLGRELSFTIAEARERIREFLDGSYRPKRLVDLIGYMTDRMLRLESRKGRDGQSANYIVDLKTNQSLPAAAVDRRLSRPGLARVYGSTLEAEAAKRAVERTPEQSLAHALRNENVGRLLAADRDAMPFLDWDDLAFSAPAMFRGREFAAQGKEIWVGAVFERASEDPAENLAIMARARAEGKKLILPALTAEDARAGRFTPGMPILLRDTAVRTKLIDPQVNYSRLTELFGMSPHDHFMAMQRRYAARRDSEQRTTNVVDLQSFRTQFQRRPAVAAPAPAPAVRSSKVAYVVRHEVLEDGRERMVLVDVGTGATSPFDPAALGAGRYRKEDGFGLPAGDLIVGVDGGYAHLDADGRYHNSVGPAIVGAPGTGQSRYALEGEFVSKSEFDARGAAYVSEFRRPEVAPEVEREDPGVGFRLN